MPLGKPLVVEGMGRYFPDEPPHEIGGAILLPGTEAEAGPTTMSHESVHAALSDIISMFPTALPLRAAAGWLPDAFNPEEELAYRLESPPEPQYDVLKARAESRRTHPYLSFLAGLYPDAPERAPTKRGAR